MLTAIALRASYALKLCSLAKLSASNLGSELLRTEKYWVATGEIHAFRHPVGFRSLSQNTGTAFANVYGRVRTAQPGWINERKPVLPNGPATSKDNDHKVITIITM